jgi:hypothetical protein
MIKEEDIKEGLKFLLPCESIERTRGGFLYYVNTKKGHCMSLIEPTDVFCVESVKNDCVYCSVRNITNVRVDLDILQKNGIYPEYAENLFDEWKNSIISDNLNWSELPFNSIIMGEQSEMTEQVSHPSHYAWLKDLCGVEPLDICRHLDFNTGNAIKYLLRKDRVDGNKTKTEKRIEDLRKAIFYINDEINELNGRNMEK